jgi:hypothetical protein
MGHYDTCRPENCPICGQARGHCIHTRPKTTSPFNFRKLVEEPSAIEALDSRYSIIAGGHVRPETLPFSKYFEWRNGFPRSNLGAEPAFSATYIALNTVMDFLDGQKEPQEDR